MDLKHRWNLSFKPLIGGGIVSFSFLLFSYLFAKHTIFLGKDLDFILMTLAVFQALIQLIFFLHLGIESKPRWNLMLFFFMVLVIFIVVSGSIWIMHNINYNAMPME